MKPKTCISVCLLKIMNAAREAATGEPIDAPSCPYKLQPDYQGKTINSWTGELVVSLFKKVNCCGSLAPLGLESRLQLRGLPEIKVELGHMTIESSKL